MIERLKGTEHNWTENKKVEKRKKKVLKQLRGFLESTKNSEDFDEMIDEVEKLFNCERN